MTKKDLEIGKALASVLTPISQVAGFAVGLTGLAYCLGWAFFNGYFRELDAKWVVPMFDTMQIVQVALTPLFSMALLAGLHLYFYSEGILKLRGLRILSVALVVIGLIALGLHYAVLHFLGDEYKSHWLVVTAICVYCFLPTVAVSEVAAVAERRSSSGRVVMFAYAYGLLAIIASVSPLLGKWNAQNDFFSEDGHDLPFVRIGAEKRCEWLLVRPVGLDRLLIANPGRIGEKPILRIVPVEQVSEVSPVAPMECIDDPK